MSAATRTRGTRTGPLDSPPRPAPSRREQRRDRPLTAAARALAALGALGVVASSYMLAVAAAGEPTQYVPARIGGWPPWLSGPLRTFEGSLSSGTFQTLTLMMCGGYVLVLLGARTLPAAALALAILAAHVAFVLGPPLISQDAFGYLGFARMGALHGLDPYTRVAAEAPYDASFPFVGWPFQHSPYGPLFTLASYATAPLGIAGGLWALKIAAALASLGAVALVARAASALGHSGRWAAAFVGLNPVLLALGVGGAHNDTLAMLAIAGALALSAHAARPRAQAGTIALAAGVGVKLSAGLALPFLVLSRRGARARTALAASSLAGLAAVALVGLIGFGTHALGFLGAIGEQQQLVSAHSIPAETARLVGLSGTPGWWRDVFAAAFAVVSACALWRTARGADWRAAAGWTTLALLCTTAWLLPWYVLWVLPLAAVCGQRRLRAAALVFCAYAMLIHLPLAEPLLTPPRSGPRIPAPRVPAEHGVELTGFKVLDNGVLDLRR
jgi:alpha-1,6-mannosyltransferase